jgi:hypothetical protein
MFGSGATVEPGVLLNRHNISLETGNAFTLIGETTPEGETITWSTGNSSIASVSDGIVTAGSTAGNTIITATITVDGIDYTDTCTVVVSAAAEG